MNKAATSAAYDYCQQLAKSHYENFPVASVLLPKHLRRPISAIYAFARTADDIADEGDATNSVRLAALDGYRDALQHIRNHGMAADDNPIFIALADTLQQQPQLDSGLLDDLLTAFQQDVVKVRYANSSEVITYCQHSANPVGRLLLQLHGQTDPVLYAQSDAICTALQLLNFYQDIQADYRNRDRIYLPQDMMAMHGIHERDLGHATTSLNFTKMMRAHYQQIARLLFDGFLLGDKLTGRFGWEIRATTLAACILLHQLAFRPPHQHLQRPSFSKWQKLGIVRHSFNRANYKYHCSGLLRAVQNMHYSFTPH